MPAPSLPAAPALLAVLVLTACGDATGPDLDPRFNTVECTASLSGTTVGNLKVRSGEACTLEDVRVNGNVVVPEGGRLVFTGGQVDGNIQADRPAYFEVVGTWVDGNIQVEHGSVAIILEADVRGDIQVKKMTGPGEVTILLADNLVRDGNLQVDENRAGSLTITGNTLSKGNMQVFKNSGTGAKVVTGNTVAQNLQCKENSLPFTATSNIAGEREDQCAQ